MWVPLTKYFARVFSFPQAASIVVVVIALMNLNAVTDVLDNTCAKADSLLRCYVDGSQVPGFIFFPSPPPLLSNTRSHLRICRPHSAMRNCCRSYAFKRPRPMSCCRIPTSWSSYEVLLH